MNSNQSSGAKQVATALIIVLGVILTGRLGWMYYDSIPRGEPQTPEEFRDQVKEMFARDRENFERDWIASGKPLPPGGFDTLFKPQPAVGRVDLPKVPVEKAPEETDKD